MYYDEATLRQERTRRLLYLVFGVSMGLSLLICAVLLYFITVPREQSRLLGSASEFPVGDVIEVAVARLEFTKTLPNAPTWSESIVYVVKQPNEGYQAFLSVDPVSGCKINWRAASKRFVDDCSNTQYTVSGRNDTGAASLSSTPQNMIEMPVEVKGDQVFVVDRMLRRSY